MGRGNVKGLNTVGHPVNTFSPRTSSVYRAHQTATAVTDHHSHKRRRRDSSPPSSFLSASRFFSTPRDKTHDHRQGGSPDDPYDLKSVTSSTSNHSPSIATGPASTASATIHEYRNVQPRAGSASKRVRRSRQGRSSSVLVLDDDGQSIRTSAAPDSPDILAQDDDGPPPSVKKLNLARNATPSKRVRQPSISEPQFKRPKSIPQTTDPIDLSEDELQAASRDPVPELSRRKTNFSDLSLPQSPVRKAKSRGDIQPTEFHSSDSPRASTPSCQRAIPLRMAISGSNMWTSSPDEMAVLIPRYADGKNTTDSFALCMLDGNGDKVQDASATLKTKPWLQISTDKIQYAYHNAPESPYIRIRRSTSPGAPPVLSLQFDSAADASEFLSTLPRSVHGQLPSERLEKMVHMDEEKAKDRPAQTEDKPSQSRSSPSTKVVVEVPARSQGAEAGSSSKAEKIKDRMLRVDQESSRQRPDATIQDGSPPPPRRFSGPETRRTRRSSPKPSSERTYKSPELWTLQNPDWEKRWHRSLVYPATGKNRATVDAADISRLDEGEFLNDNIISFYLRYLQVKLEKEHPEVLEKVYIFNSFFFEQLKMSKNKYESVRAWTAKINLFSYDYIVVPVNENYHWYLAIICNAAAALPDETGTDKDEVDLTKDASQKTPSVEDSFKEISITDGERTGSPRATRKSNVSLFSALGESTSSTKPKPRRSLGGFDPKEPRIVTLDSLGSPHSPTCRILREYLAEEAKDKKGVELAFTPAGMTAKGIPEQDNFCDCGIFVLGYMEEFLKDPDEACRRLLQKENLGWKINPTKLRVDMRDVLFALQEEQEERLVKEREAKKQARKNKRLSMANSDPPSTDQPSSSRSVSKSRPSSPDKGNVLPAEPASSEPQTGQSPTDEPSKEEEPKLASTVHDVEDTSSKDESSQQFYSAVSSPDDKTATGNRPWRSTSRPDEFVERIPSSSPEDVTRGNKRRPSTPKIRRSIEIDDDDNEKTATRKSPRRPPSSRDRVYEVVDA